MGWFSVSLALLLEIILLLNFLLVEMTIMLVYEAHFYFIYLP